jgi:hypothetical protein
MEIDCPDPFHLNKAFIKPFVMELEQCIIVKPALNEISMATMKALLSLSNIMDPFIVRHLPLITNRVLFMFSPPPALPSLTTRNEFVEKLTTPRNPKPSTLSDSTLPLKYSNSAVFFGAQKETAGGKQDTGKGVELKEVQEENNEGEDIIVLIPKPSGEPGRPGCGRYSLDIVLGVWGTETLSKVTVRLATSHYLEVALFHTEMLFSQTFVKDAADNGLDTTVSFAKQDVGKVDKICKAVCLSYPRKLRILFTVLLGT